MQRSRLKNIINKSKELSKPIGEPFDNFKNSLPKELVIGDNYRLKAAWKAYGSPKDYKEALWEGMIQLIDENTYKLPSIGYNEETDEYEYLNKGKENDTIAKDIRVWDNDVIPFVKELKLGGYIRIFNEEKDCWTYSKNYKKETPVDEETNSVLEKTNEEINYFQKGGKSENDVEIPSFLTYNPETDSYVSKYYSDDDLAEDIKWYRSKASKKFRKKYRLNDLDWEDGSPDGKVFTYIPKKKYNELSFKKYGYGSFGGFTFKDPNGEIGDGQTLRATGEFAPDGQELYESPNGLLFTLSPSKFKQGGQMSVIPEGALHAHKNHMEGAGEDFTAKGIPVVDNNGELQAEIEREEIIFSKKITDKMEELYKEFESDEISLSKKDEIAIEMGKIITCEITKNTEDRTGLINKVLETM